MIERPQSTSTEPGLHVAIIMDGNGRWAGARSLPRTEGHRAGARALRRAVEAAPDLGIRVLTVYAFSSDNWKRPPSEVGTLMRLFEQYLRKETRNCVKNGVRLSVIGRRDRLSPKLCELTEESERATRGETRLHLRIAVDYSARDAIVQAAARPVEAGVPAREAFRLALAREYGEKEPAPDVDLLIRTGGEQRLSDFLLWESAYAEFYFTPRMWPDFEATDLRQAVAHFHNRERRFGATPAAIAG